MKKNHHPLIKIINNSLYDLPSPINISFMWNFGSLLGMFLMIQIISGLFLSMQYSTHKELAFKSVMNMCLDSNFSWAIQMSHANGASLFFFCLFFHIGRGVYYQSYKLMETWISGTILFFLSMATAFMGYVLPWGQMSFWGATVITNLLATIPYLGNDLVIWLWGGFSVDNPTLNRFFVFHFILPFIVFLFIIIHLLFLHQSGSNNPLGLNSNLNKISFAPYFIYKDFLGMILLLFFMLMLVSLNPFLLGDPDNFIPANPLSTPIHIQPEWYFLFAYAILRSIPNKLGGVIALAMSIAILFFLPFMFKNKFQGTQFYFLNQFFFWSWVMFVILLTWIGMSPMEAPFIQIGQILTFLYFSYYFLNLIIMINWEKFII